MSTMIPIYCTRCGITGKVAALPKDLKCARCNTGDYLDLDDREAALDASDPMPLLPGGVPDQDADMPLVDRERVKKVQVPAGSPPYSERALSTPVNASRKQASPEKVVLTPEQVQGLRKVPLSQVRAGDKVFIPSMGTMYGEGADGTLNFGYMGFAGIDGYVREVISNDGKTFVSRGEDGERSETIPEGFRGLIVMKSSRKQAVQGMCGCEHYEHFDDTEWSSVLIDHPYLGVPAGQQAAMYVGPICDHCAEVHMAGMLLPDASQWKGGSRKQAIATDKTYLGRLPNTGDHPPVGSDEPLCLAESLPFAIGDCVRIAGHEGPHQDANGFSWSDTKASSRKQAAPEKTQWYLSRSAPESLTGFEIAAGPFDSEAEAEAAKPDDGGDYVTWPDRSVADWVDYERFMTSMLKRAAEVPEWGEWGQMTPEQRRDFIRNATPEQKAQFFGPSRPIDWHPPTKSDDPYRNEDAEWEPGYSGPGSRQRDQFYDDYYREPGDPVYASRKQAQVRTFTDGAGNMYEAEVISMSDDRTAQVRVVRNIYGDTPIGSIQTVWQGPGWDEVTARKVAKVDQVMRAVLASNPTMSAKTARRVAIQTVERYPSMVKAANAIETLTGRYAYHWVHRFRLRGREYVMFPGTGGTFASDERGDYWDAPVFANGGGKTTVRIRPDSPVEVISYQGNGGVGEYTKEDLDRIEAWPGSDRL